MDEELQNFLDFLATLEPKDRVKAFVAIFEEYCRYCGDKQPFHGMCQCDMERMSDD